MLNRRRAAPERRFRRAPAGQTDLQTHLRPHRPPPPPPGPNPPPAPPNAPLPRHRSPPGEASAVPSGSGRRAMEPPPPPPLRRPAATRRQPARSGSGRAGPSLRACGGAAAAAGRAVRGCKSTKINWSNHSTTTSVTH